jgi:predicted DNA-binding transcriptional regulator AlpA
MSVKEARPTSRATSKAQPIPPKELPTDGMSRYRALSSYIPVSREKWRTLVREGKAPQPIRLSERCVMYRNSEVHEWLKDPLNYRAEVAA